MDEYGAGLADDPDFDPYASDGEPAPQELADALSIGEEARQTASKMLQDAEPYNDEQDGLRKDNLDRYLGAPYGTERPGYSRVVDRTCHETVGWILPALLEIFHGSDETGAFEPSNPNEDDQAEHATDLVNWVYGRDNLGFLVSYMVLQDALVEGLGTWKVTWRDDATVTVTAHSGLSEAQATAVLSDPDVALLELAPREEVVAPSPPMVAAMLQQQAFALQAGLAPPPVEPTRAIVYDLTVKRTKRKARALVEAVPNNEYGYEPGARSAEAANFHYHRRLVPRADLIGMGYDDEVVRALPAHAGGLHEAWARPGGPDNPATLASASAHETMELIAYWECYLRADIDGDGVAEWRKVCLAGSGKDLLHQEIVDEPPFVPVSPLILSHRLEGLAVVDLVRDLQAIRTDVLRLMIDGLFDTTVPRWKIRHNAQRETWEALLNPETGKPIPVQAMDDVEMLQPTWSGAQALPLMEWLEALGEKRTGVSRSATGTSPDLLQNQTAAAVNQLMTAAQQKIGLIARVLAETGFKRLFMKILRLVARHQDRPRALRLRNKWVEMDASGWNADMDFQPNVGLGTGDKTKVRAMLLELLQVQREAIASGSTLAGQKQVYNLLKEVVKASNLPSVEPYFLDPESQEAQALARPPADPMADPAVAGLVATEEVKAKAALQRELIEDAYRRDKMWVDLAADSVRSGMPIPWMDLARLTSRPPGAAQPPQQDMQAPPPPQMVEQPAQMPGPMGAPV